MRMNAPETPDLLHEHFSAQLRRTPHQTALLEGDRRITFEELGARAERLASGLVEMGIGAGSMVGLHLERSLEWVACVLAILETNAAVVPLPPSYPSIRLEEILRYAELDAIIEEGESVLDPSLPGRRLSVADLMGASSGAGVPAAGSPDQPAFVLCSSGSTGRPKMIVRSHRSFFHRLRWTWTKHPYLAGERCCQKSHMTTTHAIYELFEPLLKGVPVVVISDQEVRNLEGFWGILRDKGISRLLVVPSQLQASFAIPGFVPPGMRVLVLMGEYVNPVLAERTLAAFPATTRIYSIYGSTEASSTLVCDLRKLFSQGKELPLGHPIDEGVRAEVLSPGGEPVSTGQVGRLHIGGSPLFSGYFRDPDRSASALVPVPQTEGPLYDTGDEVRRTAEGELEFVGRGDQTIKVRGFRVDLKEVERALLLHPEVRQAVAAGGGKGAGAEMLLAFVSPASVDRSGVYRTLKERLPDYMVPSLLVALDSFPRTASGKVDRRRLLAEQGGGAPGIPDSHEFSETEGQVAGIWARVLGQGSIQLGASFFEVGGTSLSVFSVVHQLREEFDLDPGVLDAQTIYGLPTIEGLASHIDQLRVAGPRNARSSAPTLVTLRKGRDSSLSPVFFIASAGGALGSYAKLSSALKTPREIIGVRDPFTWGERDPSRGFDGWVGQYLEAIRERQPSGPYYLGAYSSAGVFGYEIARRLREAGEEVAVLALVEPLAMDRRSRWRYGWWALRSTYARPHVRAFVRLVGWLRWKPFSQIRLLRSLGSPEAAAPSPGEVEKLMKKASRDPHELLSFSALLELNTGIPYTLEPSDFDGVPPEGRLAVLLGRVRELTPDVDLESMERIFLQYPMQVRAQHAYQLRPYEGRVLLIEAATRHAGLIRAQLRPYVRHLQAEVLEVGEPSDRMRTVSERFGAITAHFRCMRDDRFVDALAKRLDARLG